MKTIVGANVCSARKHLQKWKMIASRIKQLQVQIDDGKLINNNKYFFFQLYEQS